MQEYPLSVIAFAQGAAIHSNLKPINRKKYDIDVSVVCVFNCRSYYLELWVLSMVVLLVMQLD